MELIEYTLGSLLEKHAQELPEHEFIVYPDRNLRFTYAEFNDRVDKLASALLTLGVKKGDKVVINKYSGTEIKYEGEDYIIVKQSDILALAE